MRQALKSLKFKPPITGNEWLERNYRLSAGSSSDAGKWRSFPWQIAMANMIFAQRPNQIFFMKSIRVGYSKLVTGCILGLIEHYNRRVVCYLPDEESRDIYAKTDINDAIGECQSVLNIFPYYETKSSNNTLDYKKFTNGSRLYCRLGSVSRAYRQIDVDVVVLDELDIFPKDVGGEGGPIALAYGRSESVGAHRQKLIAGTSPKLKDESLIEEACLNADCFLKYYISCPCCGELITLKWGGRDVDHGIKWHDRDPSTAHYVSECCGGVWHQSQLDGAMKSGHWYDQKTGYTTKDGISWTRHGEPCAAPASAGMHIWAAYNPSKLWSSIVSEWLSIDGNQEKLAKFVNTTLGETFQSYGVRDILPENIDIEDAVHSPDDIYLVTAGVDMQKDRWEIQYFGHGKDGDIYVLGYEIINSDPTEISRWYSDLEPLLVDRYFESGGRIMKTEAIAIDTNGHPPAIAAAQSFALGHQSKKTGIIAIKGVSGKDKLVISKVDTKKELIIHQINVNYVKEIVLNMITKKEGRERIRFVAGVELPGDYQQQMTSEKRVLKRLRGHDVWQYEKKKNARNEALDTAVYAYAAEKWLCTPIKSGGRGVNISARVSDWKRYGPIATREMSELPNQTD